MKTDTCHPVTLAAWILAGIVLFHVVPGVCADEAPPLVEKYLTAGCLTEGADQLSEHLRGHPEDDQVRFGLGVLEFVQGIERLGQSLHRYGARTPTTFIPMVWGGISSIPILRMPVPRNAEPDEITYEDLRRILETFGEDLMQAEATLSEINDSDVKLRLRFGRIRLDLNGDGASTEDETLWRLYAQYAGGPRRMDATQAETFTICFDQGDVHWLRGYCHLLTAMTEIALAYDESRLFEICAHRLFGRVESPYSELQAKSGSFIAMILDDVALVHLCSFPLQEPERLRSAHTHLLAVIQQSRQSWRAIQREADNDREWVPNPQQTGVTPGARVTQQMIDAWHTFLKEAECLLEGEKLIPYWRGGELGVNLQRVFYEPQAFDLILWWHGAAATPYLETGECTDAATWQRLQQVFGGEYSFLRYAAWFN